MKVIIADQINKKGIAELEDVADVLVATDISREELIEKIGDFDAVVVRSRTKITKDVIDAASKLKIIARAGVGVDNIDVNAATEKGIMVINAPESTSISVAEHTMGLILALARKISIADKSTKEGRWEKNKFMGIELNGKILGIIGMGRIGSQVATRAKAFGMEILVYDPYISEEFGQKLGVTITDLETLLRKSDIVTIHVPLTPETRNLIDEDELELMKEDAFIINCARGGIVNEKALYKALQDKKIGGAALDVFENEPPNQNPLLRLDNVIVTPHLGASTAEAQRDAAVIVAGEIKKFFEGEQPKNVINLPVLDSDTLKAIKPYFELAEKLGNFSIQMVKGSIKEIDVTYCGELAEFQKQDILTRALLQGILSPKLTEPVNLINAPTIAKNRGIIITESKRSDAGEYRSTIRIEVKTDKDDVSIEGTFTKEPKIIKINNYKVDVKPKGIMLIAKYVDLPGTIGALGTKLGEHNINIATMQVGRKAPGGEAVMVLKVDQSIPEDVVEKLKKLDNMMDAVAVKL